MRHGRYWVEVEDTHIARDEVVEAQHRICLSRAQCHTAFFHLMVRDDYTVAVIFTCDHEQLLKERRAVD